MLRIKEGNTFWDILYILWFRFCISFFFFSLVRASVGYRLSDFI